MTSLAAICASLAAVCFCVMHIVSRVMDAKREQSRREERDIIKEELADEIKHGGNLARIGKLYERLQVIDAER